MIRFERKILIGFFFISFIVLLITSYTLVSMKMFINRSYEDKHSLAILKTIEEIHISCLDIETGVRGFLITGDTIFLNPYYEGDRKLDEQLEVLKNLDTLNTKYNHDLKYLYKFTNELNVLSDQMVLAEKSGKTDTLLRAKRIFAARLAMEKIRVTINYIENENRDILMDFNSKNRLLAINTQYSFIVSSIITICALVFLFFVIRSEFKRRKKVEQELIETQQFLDSLVEFSPNVIFSKDLKGNYRFVNKAFEKLISKPKIEIIGKTDSELFSELSTAMLTKNDNEVIKSKQAIVFEEKTSSKNGAIKYFLTTKFPIFDRYNQVKFICGISADITDRVVSEMIVKESTDRIYDLYNNAPCGYLSVARDGLILDINETMLTWLAYEKEEVVNKLYYQDFIHQESKKILLENSEIVKSKQFQKIVANDFVYVNKYGDRFVGRTSSSFILDEQGDFLSSRTVVLDITNLKKAEDNILKLNDELENNNKQLQSLNSELESFSYSVSHDLRSPLRAIDGFAKILLEDYQSKLDDEGIRLLNIIVSNSNKMSALIDDLLDFSRLGRKSISLTNFKIYNLINDVFQDLEPENKYEIINKIDAGKIVQADYSMLKIVFNNLLSNALKYSSKLDAPKIIIYDLTDEHNFVFCIEDNGVGFEMEYSNKLFKVFQRLHSESEYEGTGVGLALVHRIVEKHGGEVWAESVPDISTKFYVKIPKLITNN